MRTTTERTLLCIACALVLFSPALAQSERDSSAAPSSYTFGEILVTAIKLPTTAALSSSAVTLLSSRQIEASSATSLDQLLTSFSGVFVKDYGSSSALKTIAQRGFGPEHTLVLVNGLRVSNTQNSLVDLGHYSVEEISGLEVLHGGHSASFGADAVAGVVNIKTLSPEFTNRARLSTSVGSFGHSSVTAAGSMALPRGGVRAAFSTERGRDNFPFTFNNGTTEFALVRSNADYSSRSARIEASITPDSAISIGVYGRSFTSERGIGGLVVSPYSSSVARQTDHDHLLQLHFSAQPAADITFKLGTQFHQAYQRYVDRRFFVGSSHSDTYFRNNDCRIEPAMTARISENTRIAVGGELSFADATGSALARTIARATRGGYVVAEQSIPGNGVLFDGFLLQPALRFDAVTTEGSTLTHVSPRIGATMMFSRFGIAKPALRVSVGKNFRVPTFNELYYAGGGGFGNPLLQPERSTGFDVGADVHIPWLGSHALSTTYFNVAMNNRIQWVAAGGATVTPKNIRQVKSEGLEIHYRWHSHNDRFSIAGSYAITSARKTASDFPDDRNVNTVLIYIPHESGALNASALFPLDATIIRELGGALQMHFVGYRYTNDDNSNFLPSYLLLHGNIRTRLAAGDLMLGVKFDINNILNTSYQTLQAYPMPGRSYRLTVSFDY